MLEGLEPRIVLAADDVITVGRVLSSWSAADIQNNQEKISYTVYNDQASPATGVLLTSTLQSGVTLVSASPSSNQSGQQLAWSLGTIPAFGRAQVDVIVTFPGAIPLQLDGGAQAFATVDAVAVIDTAPAATLRAVHIDSALIASTVDANTADPFVQQQAAQLDYDPNQFFQFLTHDIGYESYVGSLRGARGTLWSGAGNALDEASLGVALFRSSGIPAQYVQGTLADADAKQLILSMFPASTNAVGIIPPGTQTADPANDPKLLAETRQHYWIQFDTGGGFVDADPTFATAQISQTFTAPQGTFSEVPDNLRHKVAVRLNRELAIPAVGLFTGGSPLSVATVLDHTFTSAELVGRSLTFSQFVNKVTLGSILTSITNTYSPYITVGDEDLPFEHSPVIRGTDYQEVITNFPLGSQILTGLFLDVDLSGPDGPTETFERTLVDRIGFDVRQNGGTPSLQIGADSHPLLSEADAFTLYAMPGLTNPRRSAAPSRELQDVVDRLAAIPPDDPSAQINQLNRVGAQGMTRLFGDMLLQASDVQTIQLAQAALVKTYFDRPRLVLVSADANFEADPPRQEFSIDLRRNVIRAIPFPGQNVDTKGFQAAWGLFENANEESIFAAASPNVVTPTRSIGTLQVFEAAEAQAIGLTAITQGNLSLVSTLNISAEAKARITADLTPEMVIVVPTSMVSIGGTPAIAWLEIDQTTGQTIGVTEDGGHQGIAEFAGEKALEKGQELEAETVKALLLGVVSGQFIGVAHQLCLVAASDAGDCRAFTIKNKKDVEDVVDKMEKLGGAGFDVEIFKTAFNGTVQIITRGDPPLPTIFANPNPVFPLPANTGQSDVTVTSNRAAGTVSGSALTPAVKVGGQLDLTWNTATTVGISATTLTAGTAEVRDKNGALIGSGAVSLLAGASAAVTGNVTYHVTGDGALASYAPATNALGISGEWNSFTATLSGSATIALTSDSLLLNGTRLAEGAYTITTTGATITGSGATTAPDFVGQLTVAITGGTVTLGPSSQNISVGNVAIDSSQGLGLGGYSGSVSISAGGSVDTVSFSGSAQDVLRVFGSASSISASQNSSGSFGIQLETSFTDTYSLRAQAPVGWTVAVDNSGAVTVVPPPGVQGGTFPVRITAQSKTRPQLIASAAVMVTVNATAPGVTLTVNSDPLITVPFAGAQLPSAFQAAIYNSGPISDTFNLTFGNVPSGFTVLASQSAVIIPAGETGIVGVYLQPNAGQPLPTPGTVLSFNVTATSASNAVITQTKTVSFTVPAIDAVTLVADLISVATTPGSTALSTITITNAGNVPENVDLSSILPSGLDLSNLSNVTLAVGQSVTDTIFLTPSAATPLNTTLSATIIATFGASGTATLRIPVRVAVPAADAIADAATAATQLGNVDLANRLNDLSISLTNLVQTPVSEVFKSQALAALDAIMGLITADPFTAPALPFLQANRDQLVAAVTANEVQNAAISLGNTLQGVANALTDEVKYNFTISLVTNSKVGTPQVPTTYQVVLQNTGTQPATYDLNVFGFPGGVTGSISPTTITLQPGQVSPGSPGVPDIFASITSTLTSQITPFSFQVRATVQNAQEISRTVTGQFNPRGEVLKVVSVTATPPFTNPGGMVNITTNILNAVNQQQTANVTYTVSDSQGNVVFPLPPPPPPVPVTLNVLTTLTPVDLGQFNTTGLAKGTYTITVSVNGAVGTGTLLVGTPVSATLSTTPTTAPTGSVTVTNTLQIDSQTPLVPPLGLVGQQAVAGSAGVAVNGDYAYVGTGSGIHIVNVANPAQPQDLSTFGAADIPAGAVVHLQVYQDKLVGYAHTFDGNNNKLLIYSLANPTAPAILGQTPVKLPGNLTPTGTFWGISGISNNLVFLSSLWYRYFLFGGQIFGQFGENIVIDISNPAAPAVASAVYNQPPDPTHVYPDGTSWPDGSSNVWQAVAADSNTWLVATTSATADSYSGPNVKGQVMVVDTTNPAAPVVLQKLEIPNTAVITGISVENNKAFFIGSTQYWGSGTSGIQGNVVVGVLDITDLDNPTVLTSQITSAQSLGVGNLLGLGNGKFVTNAGADALLNNSAPRLILVDASSLQDIVVTVQAVPQGVIQFATAAGLLFTTDNSNLLIYNFSAAQSVISATASVQIPKNTGVTIVPNSFNVPPTQTVTGANFDTLIWDVSLAAVSPSRTFTWQTQVTGLQPAESRTVDLAGTVEFTSQGTPGEIDLPPQFVTGQQVIGLTPTTRTIAPGETTTYSVTLKNPFTFSAGFELTVQGLPSSWVNIPFQTTIPAGGTVNVPLTVTPDAFAALADYQFSVTVRFGASIAFVEGDLVLQGQPVEPENDSHGVVINISPVSATAGPGTTANYVARVTNTGSSAETFHLAIGGLPIGVTAVLGDNDVEIPPGADNYRDIAFTLTPSGSTPIGQAVITVTATSTSDPAINDLAGAFLNVSNLGVSVDILSTSGSPGGTLQLLVKNTGNTTDTYDLALGGPAGLVSTLGTSTLTLGAGASQQISIQVGSIDFAEPGAILLTATAKSRTNAAISDTDSADINIAGIRQMGAAFVPAVKQLAAPGFATFFLNVNNTGNVEDAYTATITSENGPIIASLVGEDGESTQTLDIFRLPGLTTGVFQLNAALSALGQGVVHVQIRSLTNESIVVDTTATLVTTQTDVSVSASVSPDPVAPGNNLTYTIVVANNSTTDAQNVTLTDVIPTGTTFISAGQNSGVTFALTKPTVGGTGTFTATVASLAAGASATFTLVVKVDVSAAGGSTISNIASVASATADSNSQNNSATATALVSQPAPTDVSVSASVSPDPVPPGNNLFYTIVVANNSSTNAQNVTLSDVIPAGTTFISAAQNSGVTFSHTKPAVGGTGTFTATIASLAAGASATFTLVVKVDASAASGSTIPNIASVASTTADSNSQNNSATATAHVSQPMTLDCECTTLNRAGAPGTAVLATDADNPSQVVLLVTGTSKNDVIIIEPRPADQMQVRVKNTGKLLGIFGNTAFQHIVAFGLAGNDTIVVNPLIPQPATLFGNQGNDSLYGGMGNDAMDGGDGNDALFGGNGNDVLCGGAGNDSVYGQNGDDVVGGDAGNDRLYGEAGNDLVIGDNGNDNLYGGIGDDLLFGQVGNDLLFGDPGDDILVAGDGNDKLYGSAGRDLLIGGNGVDQLCGESDDDILVAGRTIYDGDLVALNAILDEWTSTDSYSDRISKIQGGGGANGIFKLNGTTVLDDNAIDTLIGGSSLDWFLFGRKDKVKDKAFIELMS